MASSPKLKPCPFCGGTMLRRDAWAEGFGADPHRRFFATITCSCGASMKRRYEPCIGTTLAEGLKEVREHVVESWNERKEAPNGRA